MDDEIIMPRRLGVDLTEKQEKALLRGMGIKQHQRFRTVEELHTALYEGVDVPAPEPELPEEPEPEKEPVTPAEPEPEVRTGPIERPARRVGAGRRAVLGAVLGLVAAAGILGLIFLPRGGEEEPVTTDAGAAVSAAPVGWNGLGRDELFANAQVAADEETLAALLADEGVEAVSLSGDFQANPVLHHK